MGWAVAGGMGGSGTGIIMYHAHQSNRMHERLTLPDRWSWRGDWSRLIGDPPSASKLSLIRSAYRPNPSATLATIDRIGDPNSHFALFSIPLQCTVTQSHDVVGLLGCAREREGLYRVGQRRPPLRSLPRPKHRPRFHDVRPPGRSRPPRPTRETHPALHDHIVIVIVAEVEGGPKLLQLRLQAAGTGCARSGGIPPAKAWMEQSVA